MTSTLLRQTCTGLLLGCLTACGGKALPAIKAPKPSEAPTDAWNQIHQKAAEDLACPIEQLQTRPLSSHDDASAWKASFEIQGCDNVEIYSLVSAKSGPWVIYSDKDLRSKLKFSFAESCPTWTVEFIDDATRGVTACEQKLVYVMTASGWVANTATSSDGMAP
ncbi:MAG TPA: hypothetical protein VLC09_03755 [Polyangiaceae bacterium]|nr:hypothetical protein [Polyangiaceae bacterium]